ncbi:PadR family transcriptional regulator [uncultured Amnibacterium sp.]|uniref:PadR family transcriptional regulator n=1 Tax=uncultured Amnibacterium sp. TaxID=1631851 RepID=UPI0035CC9F5B
MTRSSTSSSPVAPRPLPGVAQGLSRVRQAIDLLRNPAEQPGGARPERGDVRAAVLTVLAEQPMNGYQIVRTLEERGRGAQVADGVRPSAGAVYPTLQLLADEGLATAAEEDGKKIYTLTASGRVAAQAAQNRAPSEVAGRMPERRGAIARSGAQLAQAVALVAQSGTAQQVADTAAVLDEARRNIHSILARH